MKRSFALWAALLVWLTPALARATANYVYHEQTTTSVGGACGPYLTRPAPAATQSYPLEFKIEYQFYTDNAFLYYTTDGTAPSGSHGTASGTSQAIAASYACTFLDPLGSGMNDDTASATIPAQPVGTTVKYIVSAWHSSPVDAGLAEVFANSGTCSGCTACEDSSCATVFTYTVLSAEAGVDASADVMAADASPDVTAVDAGDAAPADAGADAGSDPAGEGGGSAGDAGEAGADAAGDAPTDAGVDAATDEAGRQDGSGMRDAADAAPPHGPPGDDLAAFDAGFLDAGPGSGSSGGCSCSMLLSPAGLAGSSTGYAVLLGLALARRARTRRGRSGDRG